MYNVLYIFYDTILNLIKKRLFDMCNVIAKILVYH